MTKTLNGHASNGEARRFTIPPSPNGSNGAKEKDAKPSPNDGRDAHGRFAAGNAGGPGNPFARRLGALRSAFLGAVSDEDMQAIAKKLVARAKKGNLAAAKILLAYVIGRPAESIDPDRHDLEELQMLKELPQVVSLLQHLVEDKVSFAEGIRMMRMLVPVMDQHIRERIEQHFREKIGKASAK